MAQKLDPELQQIYERVMKTPTPNKPKTSTPSSATPSPSTPPASQTKTSDPFLSSMPMQPSKNLGVKSFTFTGKKKIVTKDEKMQPLPKDPTAKPQSATTTTQTTHIKTPASKKLIFVLGIIVLAAWAVLWMFVFGFMS